MTTSRIVLLSALALRLFSVASLAAAVHAQPNETVSGQKNRAAVEQQRGRESTPAGDSQVGHFHRSPVLSSDETRAYAERNYRIAGVFVLFAGGLALLAAASGDSRYTWARYGWPILFFLLGVFLFVRHDPESWPWGPNPLGRSFADPQVLQHTLFTFIVLAIGVIEWLRCMRILTRPAWGLVFPTLAISAAAMLLLHRPGSGPSADTTYRYHVVIAIAGIAAMVTKVLDDSRLFTTRLTAYLWPALVVCIGCTLLIYTE